MSAQSPPTDYHSSAIGLNLLTACFTLSEPQDLCFKLKPLSDALGLFCSPCNIAKIGPVYSQRGAECLGLTSQTVLSITDYLPTGMGGDPLDL